MTDKTKSFIIASLCVGAVITTIVWVVMKNPATPEQPVVEAQQAPAAGASNITPARMATSSTIQVGPQQNKTLFALNASCASRTIGTAGQGIMLAFDGVMTPGAAVGFWQAASTTVTYPASETGCAAVTAYAAASTTISIAEANR